MEKCLNEYDAVAFNLTSTLYNYTIKTDRTVQKERTSCVVSLKAKRFYVTYEGWNFNSGNYLFTTDTK